VTPVLPEQQADVSLLAPFLVFCVNAAMIGTRVAQIPCLQDHLSVSKATSAVVFSDDGRGLSR
jgi:hypothetical protein